MVYKYQVALIPSCSEGEQFVLTTAANPNLLKHSHDLKGNFTLHDILIIAPRQRRYLGKPKMLVGRRTAVKKHIQGKPKMVSRQTQDVGWSENCSQLEPQGIPSDPERYM